MSDETPLLRLPLLQPAQAQKHVTHNEALRLLDITVQLAVLDRDLQAPPALPQEGDRYIIGPAPTGAWQGRAGQIAAFWGGVWVFVTPQNGWQARVLDEARTLHHQGGVWSATTETPRSLPELGIATNPDATNRLAVVSAGALFSHAGAGHRLAVNKATPADIASLLFQTAFSGRAELGLAGTDSFSLKVSADGTTFVTALGAHPASGTVTLPAGLSAPLALVDATDPTRRVTLDLSTLPAGSTRSFSFPDVSSEIATLAGSQSFSGQKTFAAPVTLTATTASLGTAAGNATYAFGTGPTAAGASKTVTLGGGGVAGSVTTIAIGPTQPGASATLALHGGTVQLGPTVTDFDMGSASARATAIGIGGATGDGTNRLSVNSPGILFNHSGSGVEATLNKANPAAQGMVSFKTGFSSRAQLGLIGTDDLSLRVSPDGTAFVTALTAEAATGRLTLTQPAILSGQTADPASPSDGMVWHNMTTGQLCARVAGQTHRLDGQQGLPWLTPPAGELVATTTGATGAVGGVAPGAAGRLDLFPFLSRSDIAVDRLVLNVTTTVAPSLGRVVVYAADAQGRPAQLLLETGDIDLSIAGMRTATVAMTFRQGRTYWLGMRSSSTATVSTWNASSTPDINGGTLPATTLRKILRRTVAWGTPAPATWGYTSAEVNAAAAPAIWLRVA